MDFCEEALIKGTSFILSRHPTLANSILVKQVMLDTAQSDANPQARISAWFRQLEKSIHQDQVPANLERLKQLFEAQYALNRSEIPENYFKLQLRIARERGLPPPDREHIADLAIKAQRASLQPWLDYLLSDNISYPMWARYWAWSGLVQLGAYDPELGVFAKRSKGQVAPFADLNPEALARVLSVVVQMVHGEPISGRNEDLQDHLAMANFGTLYGLAVRSAIGAKADLKVTAGQWVTFYKGSDVGPLVCSLRLKSTGWCTASENTARDHLRDGNFHVYYSFDAFGQPTVPRLAIRMDNEKIMEVRGIAKSQNIDAPMAMTDILTKKLKEFGKEGELYEVRLTSMKYLSDIERRSRENEELTLDELRFLYEVDHKIVSFGFGRDPRIDELIGGRNIKADLVRILGNTLKESEISLTAEEAVREGIKYHHGNLDLYGVTNLAQQGLSLPEVVSGYLNLPNLESSDGLGAKMPKEIHGDIMIGYLKEIKNVKFPPDFKFSIDLRRAEVAENIVFPVQMKGELNLFAVTRLINVSFPEILQDGLALHSLRTAERLKLPRILGGSLTMPSLLTLENVTLPDWVGGSVYLDALSYIENAHLPAHVGGSLDLRSVKWMNAVVFPAYIGVDLNLYLLESALGVTLTPHVGGTVQLNFLKNREGLNLPVKFRTIYLPH